MSKGYWASVICTSCEMHCTYTAFQNPDGLSFSETVQSLYVTSEDSKTWVYKRRGTVLGKMHQAKLQAWEEMIRTCPGF